MSQMSTLIELKAALPGLSYNDCVRKLAIAEQQSKDAPALRIAILRSFTIEPLDPILRLHLLLDGWTPSIWFGGYDQYTQEILDHGSALQRFRPDVVLLFVRLEEFAPEFLNAYPSRPADQWADHLATKARELATLASRASQGLSAQVIVQNAVLPHAYYGIFDAQCRASQREAVAAFNRELAAAADGSRGVLVWDFQAFVQAKGFDNLMDPKAWYVSRNPFKPSAYIALAADLAAYVVSAMGRVRKCVVVDLDNTLWGGIAGEDGVEGIQLSASYPGNCYRDLQRELLKLHDRGILLAINSKNNEADALRIIDEHPDMVLRRRHFAAVRINWQDKATNLRELATELNIGLDSFVFIDDNPAECNFLRRECPECVVVQLPDKPYLLPAAVRRLGRTETVRLTAEDRQKSALYQARTAQRQHEASLSNIEDFLRSLELEVTIEPAAPFSIPRIAQLTQKTNQMNMTTRRYTEAQIASAVSDPRYGVFSVRARDRFGDHGIIGVLMIEYQGDLCRIDTFLLSCRVIGRGIEDSMISFAADRGRSRGCRMIAGEFYPTAKNAPAAGFYPGHGFNEAGAGVYTIDLEKDSFPPPAHIRLTGDTSAYVGTEQPR